MAFALGAVLGSFANVLIYRLPRRESIVFPGSRCPHCQAPIRPWDNIPILSYVLLRGHCRQCGGPIAVRYPIVEAAGGLVVAGLVWQYGLTLPTLRFVILAVALIVAFFTDLECGLIPNTLTYPGIILGILLSTVSGNLRPSLLAAAGAGGFFLLVGVLSRGGMGGGDVKLAAMIGAFLGPMGAILSLFLAVTIGAAVALILLALRLRTRKDTMPFGPALALGTLIALFGSDAIVRWYLTIMHW